MKFFIVFLLFPFFLAAQTELQKIESLMADKQFAKAEKLVTAYLQTNPKDLKARELQGDTFGYQKKWDEALNVYRELVNEHPNSANYHYKYGGALGMKALSISKIKAVGIIGDAKKHFIEAANLDPKHIDARWALVEVYMQLPGIIGGSKSKALSYADELEKLSPVDGYLAKGYIYEYDKDLKRAEHYFKQAVKVGGSLVCYEKLTHFYLNRNSPEKAIATVEAGFTAHQHNLLNYQLGKIAADYNTQLQKGEKALHSYLEKYALKDGMPKSYAHFRLAQIYRLKKQQKKALEMIDLALYERPDEAAFKIEKKLIDKL